MCARILLFIVKKFLSLSIGVAVKRLWIETLLASNFAGFYKEASGD